MPTLTTAGAHLHYEDHPPRATTSATPVLLVHGLACDLSDWSEIVERLTGRRRIAVDLRGCGGSVSRVDDYTPGGMTEDLLALLDHLGLSHVVLVGHSAGAEVAATVALTQPGRVEAVVAIEPAYGFAAEGGADRVLWLAHRMADGPTTDVLADYFVGLEGAATPPEIVARHGRSVHRARPEVVRAMHHDFAFGAGTFHFRPDTDTALRGRQMPMLAVYSTEERATVGGAFVAHCGDAVLTYPGSGHWPHQEQPDRLVADLESWLATVARRRL